MSELFKKNYSHNNPGHARAPGKCKLAKPWKLPVNRGQVPLAPAEPAAPPLEAQAPPPLARLRAPRPDS
eukprot:249925-Pyramimonas_sp.AAC.1